MKQAERATDAEIKLHVERQKALGEKMIGDSDNPVRIGELLVTAAVLIGMAVYAYHNQMYPFN